MCTALGRLNPVSSYEAGTVVEGRQDRGHDGGAQAQLAGSVDAAQPGLRLGELVAPFPGAVRRIIVNDEHVRVRQNPQDLCH